MTMRHITLASVGALLGIIGSIYAGVTTVSKRLDDSQQAAIQRAIRHEQHDEEIDSRLQRLELAVRMVASDKSSKDQYLLNQILTLKQKQQQVEQAVISQQPTLYEKAIRNSAAISASAPAVSKPEP